MKPFKLTIPFFFTFLVFSFFSFFFIPATAAAQETTRAKAQVNNERKIVGRVVGVHDGDTITVLDEFSRQHKIRFNGIDAPELKQDFGNKAKENLSNLVFGKQVTVIYDKTDKYGRTVGTVFVDGVDVNLEQIKAGLAWHYKKYEAEQTEANRRIYSDAEIAARNAKKGLWAIAAQTPPWNYRGERKEEQASEKAGRKYMLGDRGGCYYLNSSGKKSYVDKKFCANETIPESKTNTANSPIKPVPATTTKTNSSERRSTTTSSESPSQPPSTNPDGRTYLTGPKGGCYYLNNAGKKVYVDKAKCGQ